MARGTLVPAGSGSEAKGDTGERPEQDETDDPSCRGLVGKREREEEEDGALIPYKVGQHIDVLDSVDRWAEAKVPRVGVVCVVGCADSAVYRCSKSMQITTAYTSAFYIGPTTSTPGLTTLGTVAHSSTRTRTLLGACCGWVSAWTCWTRSTSGLRRL